MKRTIAVLFCVFVFFSVSVSHSWADEDKSLSVLLIGNSYTYANDLPGILRQMLVSKGYAARVEEMAIPGWTLAQHANSQKTISVIKQQCWDFIILQEQSALPTYDGERKQSMIPAISTLKNSIQKCDTKVVLFMTWGYQHGLRDNNLPSYEQMQEKLTAAYEEAARETDSLVAPVGIAWRRAYEQSPSFSLWVGDGSHPSLWGTYLAACVFYKFLTGEDPQQLPGFAQLNKEATVFLQKIAAQD